MDTVVLGLLTGLAAGAVMARGGLCFNSGLRGAAFEGSPRILRAFAIAVAVQMLLLALLAGLGLELTRIGLFPVAQLAGGLLFGAGMALAGGCIAGILWKAGAGSTATGLAIAGFAAGELLIRGPGGEILEGLDGAVGRPAETTLYGAVGLPFGLLAALLGAVALGVLLRRSRSGLGPGLALGAVATAAWLTASLADHHYGLGFVGSVESTRESIAGGDLNAIPFPFYVALGLIGGGVLAAGGRLRLPDAPRAARAVAGGLMMGVGGSLAHGCNIGNGLTGIPVLSLGSIWATAWMAAGALLTWRLALAGHPALRGTERFRRREAELAAEL